MDSKIKQRLVGAVVLIGLVAIVLPIIFHNNNPLDNKLNVSAVFPQAPAKPEGEALIENFSIEAEGKRKTLIESQSERVQSLPKPIIASTAHHKDSQTQSPEKVQSKQQALLWVVQLASFHDKAHADKLQDKVKSYGYPVYIHKARSSHKKLRLYQVMVGPLSHHQQAKKIKQKLLSTVNLKGLVLKVAT